MPSYQSKDSGVSQVQLNVREVCLKLTDSQVISASASTVTIDLKETIKEVRLATFFDDSAGTNLPVTAANQSISGTTVTLTLSAPMAAADSVTVKHVITESAI